MIENFYLVYVEYTLARGEITLERVVGTVVRGLRGPIINQGCNIQQIVVDAVLNAAKVEGFMIEDRDIVTITESIVARAQGNYATIDDIAADIKAKFGEETVGVIFPILSRNRFAICLRGIAKGIKHVVLMLNYPSDEVGNHLVDLDKLDEKGINPWTDVLTEAEFRQHFGYIKHPFTGVDYIEYYRNLIEAEGATCQIIFSNNPKTILNYTKQVLTCDIHSRFRTKRILKNSGAEKVYGLDDFLTESINGSGFNEKYGLLGSNKATEDRVKLFPNTCQSIVDGIQAEIKDKTGKTVEVMVYGDGAFKDPVGKIWELADPVVSPAYTAGLEGTPNEVKLKYLADNNFSHLCGEAQRKAISEYIQNKCEDLVGSMEAQGTTPRRLTDLIGSLSDLTSGSGDKGTPIVYIKGYFDNYTK
ncbi:F420-0:Gamma-glutamyl ligase [Desulfitobacterium dehalogenans ATCC 51507]|uniref:F420-0:Gamma-glutamyl ligase n=1 Tax=Desulfitobacterium dehalogenans (strain ATCC 51507 / DSM 9161 / JW/IU-DC1) TaxID=756499 RepID=I4AET4_DESDJ|nr:F420-0:Gamma-glutamyl ligase [Desulfitobacterium dehalogenans ATCC 51507]